MITALKKKFGPPASQNGSQKPTKTKQGIGLVTADLQKKFANGVNYNMKVVIRGDRNTGKTCLWKRLQGHPFIEEYLPTDEIQVSNITWNYRTSDFIVKVDVWDVVDESRRRKPKNEGLKLDNTTRNPSPSSGPEDMMVCDATFVDVYKNCNGVLLTFDITRTWTWDYVCRELDKVPSHIPVLVIGNKCDLDAKREVKAEKCTEFLASFKRRPLANGKLEAPIRFTHASMKLANGLRYLYNFLNIPFLCLQREQLEKALDVNKHDIEVAQYELDCFQASPNSPPTDSHDVLPHQRPNDSEVELSIPGTPEVQRKKSISSGSGDENGMVDMYEEDFDSNDEYHKSLSTFVGKSGLTSLSASPQPKSSTNCPSSVSNGSFSEDVRSKLTLETFTNTSGSKSPEEQLDSWLDSAITPTTSVPGNLMMNECSDDDGDNPLVAPIECASDDEDDEDELYVKMSVKMKAEPALGTNKKERPNRLQKDLEEFYSPSSSSSRKTKAEKPTSKQKKKKSSDVPRKGKKKASDILKEDTPVDASGDYDPL